MTKVQAQKLAKEHLDKHCKYDSISYTWYTVIQGIYHKVINTSDISQENWGFINTMLHYYSFPPLPFPSDVQYDTNLSLGEFITLKEAMSECSHSYKKYVGLAETFEFCEKCDKRKE